MFDDRSQYLKIDEAARLLGVSARTIYRWIWKGELPASKVGGLYFIPRTELQKKLDLGTKSKEETGVRATSAAGILKCSSCYRLITSETQIGGICKADGCEQILCDQCTASGVSYCAQHAPDRDRRLAEAEAKLRRGEIPMLVKCETARLREVNFTNRIQARLASIKTLAHPVSGDLISLPDWSELLEQTDERREVMRLLGKVYLDADTMASTPLNPCLTYRLLENKKHKEAPLEIQVRVMSRLNQMLHDGFDTQPLGAGELTPWLVKTGEEVEQQGVFRMVLLASTCGWDAEARRVIQSEAPGQAFMHRMAIFYLYDLEQGELVYNQREDRARPYAELFAPLLPSDELPEVTAAIEKELVVYDSLTFEMAAKILPYPSALIRKAFERLASTGRYALNDVAELGLTLIRL